MSAPSPRGAGRPGRSGHPPTRGPSGGPDRPRGRQPRFLVFVVSGVVLALVVSAVLTLTLARPDGRAGVDYGLGGVFGYLAGVLGAVGALAGGLVAVVLGAVSDRRARRRPRPR